MWNHGACNEPSQMRPLQRDSSEAIQLFPYRCRLPANVEEQANAKTAVPSASSTTYASCCVCTYVRTSLGSGSIASSTAQSNATHSSANYVIVNGIEYTAVSAVQHLIGESTEGESMAGSIGGDAMSTASSASSRRRTNRWRRSSGGVDRA